MTEKNRRVSLLSRRNILAAGGACIVAGAFAGAAPRRLLAASSTHSFKLGAAEITIFSDGVFSLPLASSLPDTPKADVAKLFAEQGADLEMEAQTNVTLVRIGETRALIDTGAGTDFIPTLGKLSDRLDAAGVAPDSITHVVFTHAHADHFWGVLDPFGDGSRFANARHVMSRIERDFWMAADVAAKVPEAQSGMAAGTQRRLKALADIMTTAEAGAEIAPGLALLDTPGHTPGHVSVSVRDGTEEMIILGDALVHAAISFAAPTWRWGADIDSDTAIATRVRLLDDAAARKVRLVGYHLPWPGVGFAERRGTAYRFVPA